MATNINLEESTQENKKMWKAIKATKKLRTLSTLGGALLALSALTACGPTEPAETATCPDENRVLLGEHKYCVIDQTIIEKGFSCPADLSYRHDVPGAPGAVCSDMRTLPKVDIDPLKDLVNDPPGTGVWVNKPAPKACTAPNPSSAGCSSDASCASGESCEVAAQQSCVPSSCSCDGVTGSWICTEDCGELKECVDVVVSSCPGPDPSMQECDVDADCAGDKVCVPSDAEVCIPSACGCDEASGLWTCTADCGGGRMCADPAPKVCGDGTMLSCKIALIPCPTGLEREVVNGCYGECVNPVTCESPVEMCNGTPDPSYRECSEDADCAGDAVCAVSATLECVPSSCVCGGGVWSCSDDCGQGRSCQADQPSTPPCSDGTPIACDPVDITCPEGLIREVMNSCYGGCVDPVTCEPPVEMCGGTPNPSTQPCRTNSDCSDGKECLPSGDDVCVPSSCGCDTDTNTWFCTEDCGEPFECLTP